MTGGSREGGTPPCPPLPGRMNVPGPPSPPLPGVASDPASARGRAVAGLLAGAWRPSPPPLELSSEELSAISPVLYRQGSSGLAWHRIRESPLRDTAEASLLRDGYRYHSVRVSLLERQLAEIVPFLESRGVEPILAKGWALGRLYPETGLRPYGDLDLMVEPGALARAREALTDPGRPDAPLELHDGFPMLRDRSSEVLRERSRVVSLAGVPIRILGPEDHLRLACLHGLNHGLSRPLWLCDVALILEAGTVEFDWEYVRSGDRWLSDGVRCGLALARDLLGVSLDVAGVPDAWQATPLPAWLPAAALRAFGARQHYLEAGDPGELLLKPARLAQAAKLRWVNPIEATYRRRAGWDESPRLPVQLEDYLARGLAFAFRIPSSLRVARAISRQS